MRRRDFIASFGAAAASFRPIITRAQRAKKTYKVGYLGNSKLDTPEAVAGWDAFRFGLRDRGWIEGSNLIYLFRFAEGIAERHAGNARELVEAGVDLIVAVTGTAALAAKRSSETVPVVFANVPNPVEMGLVASIARPEGNLTGLTTLGLDVAGKRMELLKEVFPKASRVAFLVTGRQAEFDRSVYGSAEKLGIQLLPAKVSRAEEIKNVMTEMADVDAWFINEEAIFFTERRTIIELVATQRKPAMYPSTFFVDAGGLISYSVGQPGQYGRLAALADRILRGTKPADLPVEQPVEFELAVNLRTARSLALEISPLMLSRADRVIE